MQAFIYKNYPHLILESGGMFNLSKIEPIDIENLKKLAPTHAIPIDQLKAKIASLRQIETNKSTSWMYCVGGGSHSGSILLIVISCLVC